MPRRFYTADGGGKYCVHVVLLFLPTKLATINPMMVYDLGLDNRNMYRRIVDWNLSNVDVCYSLTLCSRRAKHICGCRTPGCRWVVIVVQHLLWPLLGLKIFLLIY